jgi:hypothetical protein
VFPNTTVRLFAEAGSKPGGVNAVAAPASTTRRSEGENMVAAQEQNNQMDKKYQQ